MNTLRIIIGVSATTVVVAASVVVIVVADVAVTVGDCNDDGIAVADASPAYPTFAESLFYF